VNELRSRYPRLLLAGYRDGYFADDEAPSVARQIGLSGAHILFVAMTSPRKEYFLGEYGRRIGVRLAMGVGGSIDVVAGKTTRAPLALQRLGLEWLYRMMQEPRRLARRYLVTNARFAALVAREVLRRWRLR
jgi:N-acetylglucosaminyldiphosphoundecaprenol N-acetyl-beta-D-mannosaminyltransferase